MKKWIWFLVLPWVIVDDMTWPPKYVCEQVEVPDGIGFRTFDRDYCLDMAESLNAAHDRRNRPKPLKLNGKMVPPCEDLDPSEYKNGCYANYEFKP